MRQASCYERVRKTLNIEKDCRRGKVGDDGTYVTQMVKHSADPMNAMMLSNAGKTIAMAVKQRIVPAQTRPLAIARLVVLRPGSRGWLSPNRTSTVLMMGRTIIWTTDRTIAQTMG